MKTKVFNLIILDESGSMQSIKQQALTGVNETLQTIREAQKKHPYMRQYVSILPFQSTRIAFLRDCTGIDKVKDLCPQEYNPRTGTPLYDAIGIAANHLRQQVSDQDSVLVTVITDGYENASKEYNAHTISQLVEELKGKGWLFTYIGANQDAISVARTLNIRNAMNFVEDEEGTRLMFRRERKSRQRHMEEYNKFLCEVERAPIMEEVKTEMMCCHRMQMADRTDYFNFDSDEN